MDNFITRFFDKSKIQKIKNKWGKENKQKRNFKQISGLFSKLKKYEEIDFFIDDQTFEDLNMKDIFSKIDRTNTTVGQQVLYNILRTPLLDEEKLRLRDKYIEFFQNNPKEREKVELELFKIGKSNSEVFDLIWDDLDGDKNRKYLFYILPCISIALIGSIFVVGFSKVMLPLVLDFVLNTYFHFKTQTVIGAYVNSIKYLGAIIKGAGKIGNLNIDELKEYGKILKENSNACKEITKKSGLLGESNLGELADSIRQYINVLFLVEERAYFRVIGKLKDKKEELKKIYLTLGEVDSLISVASYREQLQEYCKPELINEGKFIEAKNLKHPLVENAIGNNVHMNNKGIILTGSNMSGKSTFLRTIGVNSVLAQSILTCTADEYKASYFHILSSISPSDNLVSGKSYYFGEVEALLRIIKKCNEEVPTLALIDEIFRGTNPVERISAALEILKYLDKNNCLVTVATHDLELTKLLVNEYNSYYFREEVEGDKLIFDYLIKKGVSPTRNAIRILKYIGYPQEIVENAEKRILNCD
ncbi:DNA mismatch repair protein MutS [Clostridiaceae bacterium 14S0207]|nr:DNA mismatch repair protein MutS [Clostridiaceae bacterium 14S0207]